MSKIKSFFRDESGQAMTEYGLIIALVAIAVIVALGFVTGGLNSIFTKISTALNATH